MSGQIDCFASQIQYAAWCQPVWAALPVGQRGHLYVGMNRPELLAGLTSQGWETDEIRPGRPPWDGGPLIMAGGADLIYSEGRPVVFCEHGAGQVYQGIDSVSYSGGIGRVAVALFLCPNSVVAERNQTRYPNAQVAIVGGLAVPDPRTLPRPEPGLIGITWHWDAAHVVPEAGWAWPEYADAALEVAKARPVLGHAHPRGQYQILPWWQSHGVETTTQWTELRRRAEVLVTDNSSVLFEFARLDRPVVVVNSIRYRRHVHHGLRFWRYADVGIQVERPEELLAAVNLALRDRRPVRERRRRAALDVFPFVGEQAAGLAAEAIQRMG